MTKRVLENKIVKLLPSQTLKNYIAANGFHFQEKDLLKFVENYSLTYLSQMQLLNEITQVFCDRQVVAQARKLLRLHEKQYAEFMRAGDDVVYEIDIKCYPYDRDPTYIVKEFDDVFPLIRNYLKYYKDVGAKDNNLSQYIITKKTNFPPTKPSDIGRRVGRLGECVLGKGLSIKSVSMYNSDNEFGKCHNKNCEDCDNQCVDVYQPHFPHFLKKYDLVSYRADLGYLPDSTCDIYRLFSENGFVSYGILTIDMNEYDDDTHVVLLDNRYIKERNAYYQDEDGFYRIYDDHDHPSYAVLDKVDLSTVSEKIRDDYMYAVEALKKINNEN